MLRNRRQYPLPLPQLCKLYNKDVVATINDVVVEPPIIIVVAKAPVIVIVEAPAIADIRAPTGVDVEVPVMMIVELLEWMSGSLGRKNWLEMKQCCFCVKFS
ncbi:hypothetical protein NC651_013904 [Populus alba x Populus x berolinensis]|nr:hypothetical protein NC651_013904 [Populus alba x Populus x berolinensis]